MMKLGMKLGTLVLLTLSVYSIYPAYGFVVVSNGIKNVMGRKSDPTSFAYAT